MRSLAPVARVHTCTLALAIAAGTATSFGQATAPAGKVPITTSSEEARQLYLKGRDLAEKLRATDARRFYEQAVARDASFALGHVGLANTAPTTRDFIEAATRAASLADRVSPGERHIVLGLEATMKGDPASALAHYTELVRLFPDDERALTLLGNLNFGRQDYEAAVRHFARATAINPEFSQPYNQLGYAYRFLDRLTDAEAAFKKYIQLIPGDPNPHDSYAELLMKMGRFDESIASYEKALAMDPNFVASYIGIGNNHLFAGRPEKARAAFARIGAVARNTGERRLSHFWTAAAYVHEGATEKALAELRAGSRLAEGERDAAAMSGDLTQIGDVLREAGRLDEALASYREAVTVIEKADVPSEVKAATVRTHVFEEARVAAVRKDVAAARAKAAEYETRIAGRHAPFEARQHRELLGLIALAEGRASEAADHFLLANQQDPRILYLTAVAFRDAGRTQKASAFASKAATFNSLAFDYAYVRGHALKMSGGATE